MSKSIEVRDESSLNQDAYKSLCEVLFSHWNRYKGRQDQGLKNYARTCRNLLTNLHQLYAKDQACPSYYAKMITKLTETHCFLAFETN